MIGLSFQIGLEVFDLTPRVVFSLIGSIGGGIYPTTSSIIRLGDTDLDSTMLVSRWR